MSETLAKSLLDAAKAKGKTVSVAESCTGGMVAAAITDMAGSSAIFEHGFVTYSNAAKIQALGVAPSILQTFGAVSEQVVGEMADGARRVAGADVAVAISGIAGPGGSEHKPEGRVCFGVAGPDGTTVETVEYGPRGRAEVRSAARTYALALLLAAIEAD